ncbi:hypothetical protein [Actinomadura roseirufa]|uniref:hypothetical protein n=1 Tax=Actinomadura roseirufa TaxID=2094049 RepID=UPI001041892A|nr:hypothetical protein [Actinomadura roseirufa]
MARTTFLPATARAGPDRRSASAPEPVTSWYVDAERQWTSRYGCCAASSSTGGLGTAGHCGGAGKRTGRSAPALHGTSGGSSSPGDDRARTGALGHGEP